MNPNPMERLVENIMSTNIELPVEVVKLFVKLRFFQRIRTLNTNLAKHFTRNMKQFMV